MSRENVAAVMAEVSRAPYLPTSTDLPVASSRYVPLRYLLSPHLTPHPYPTKAVCYVSPRACRYLSSTQPRPWRAALPAYIPLYLPTSPRVMARRSASLYPLISPYIISQAVARRSASLRFDLCSKVSRILTYFLRVLTYLEYLLDLCSKVSRSTYYLLTRSKS